MSVRTTLVACDKQQSVLHTRDSNGFHKTAAYTAYGYLPAEHLISLGFNGERSEPTGHYLLGGYRLYSPILRRFHSPDSLSPFGKGGLNAYAYALADPINRKDPTGHIPQWGAIVAGIAGTAIGLLTGGIGSALALATLTKATTIGLGVVSITSGAASAALDLVGRKSDDSALQIAAVGFAFVSGFAGGLAIQGRAGVGLPRQPKYSKLPLPRKSATPTPPPAKPMIDLNSNYVDVTTRGPRANSLISGIADGMSGIDPRIKPGYRPLPNTPATARFHRYWLTTGEPTGVGNMYHNPNQTLVRRTGETSVNLAYYILGLRG